MAISKIFDILVEVCFAIQNFHDFLDFWRAIIRKLTAIPQFFLAFLREKVNDRHK